MEIVSAAHKKLGQRIKEARAKRGMTQEDLAFSVGIDRSYMGFLERGERNPTLSNLIKIAKSLGIPLSELFRSI